MGKGREDMDGEGEGEDREGIRRGQERTPCTEQAVHVNRRPSDYLLLCRLSFSSPSRIRRGVGEAVRKELRKNTTPRTGRLQESWKARYKSQAAKQASNCTRTGVAWGSVGEGGMGGILPLCGVRAVWGNNVSG